MSDVSVEEAQQMLYDLERDLLERIVDFENKTGLRVESVAVLDVESVSIRNARALAGIRIGVSLR